MVRYVCKGPRLSDEEKTAKKKKLEKQISLLEARTETLKARKVVDLAAFKKVEDRLTESKEELADPLWEARQRHGCGADVTKEIEAVPADGLDYWVACPKCGTETRVAKFPPPPEETPG